MKCRVNRREQHVQRDQTDTAEMIVSGKKRIGARGEVMSEDWACAEDDERAHTQQQHSAVVEFRGRKA